VVPAAVASLLVAEGVDNGDELVTTVALAIVVTLLLQSTTKPWLARKLGLVEPELTEIPPERSDEQQRL
jgi:NhaP-type Na+/H+ or K+/H+ antiporter